MKKLIFLLLLFSTLSIYGQRGEDYFVPSANHYLQNQNDKALETINKGLQEQPNNKKLIELKKKIEEQKEQDKKKGDNKDGDNQQDDAKQNPDENDSQQDSPQDDGRNKGQKGAGSSELDPIDADGNEPSDNPKDQGERLKEQRYEYILKALENQEQETQRRLMMGKSKSKLGRKQKDW